MTIGLKVGLDVGLVVGATTGMDENGTIAATLDATEISPVVETNATPWAATLTWQTLGTAGNGQLLNFRFDEGPAGVEVHDNQSHDGVGWSAAPGTVGIRARGEAVDPLTVGTIESAINASSALAQVTAADPSPTKEIDVGLMDTVNAIGTFSGGL